MPLRIGETFAGYRILRLLGSGGMGEVYLVRHPRLPREEAMKVLRPDISRDASFRERFIREADLAAGLRHPAVVGVHDRGDENGQLWIAMDYIDGTDAAQLLEQRYPAGMPAELVMRIITAVAGALDYAHKKGLLHRDVKPANIIVAELDGDAPDVYLADFGIARPLDDVSGITTTNMTVGTVAYSAPEQLLGEPMDGRADQYALAATSYHLLTGSQLFPNSNPAVVISRHLTAPVPALADTRPELASLDSVLTAGLAKDLNDRFASCTDYACALTETSCQHVPRVGAAPTTPAPTARRSDSTPIMSDNVCLNRKRDSAFPRTRRLIGISITAVVVLVGVIGVLWRTWQHPQSDTTASSAPTAPETSTSSSTTASAAPVPTSTAPAPASPPNTVTTPSATVTTPASNPNGPGCSSQRLDKCRQWTPEQAAFACRAVLGGADYAEGLKRMLMNRYGLSEDSAFFLGKEAMYSISSGGAYIPPPSNAEGLHPLCNDIVP